jgi:hypothetical protein
VTYIRGAACGTLSPFCAVYSMSIVCHSRHYGPAVQARSDVGFCLVLASSIWHFSSGIRASFRSADIRSPPPPRQVSVRLRVFTSVIRYFRLRQARTYLRLVSVPVPELTSDAVRAPDVRSLSLRPPRGPSAKSACKKHFSLPPLSGLPACLPRTHTHTHHTHTRAEDLCVFP